MVPLGAGIAFVSQVQQKHFGNIFGLTAGAVLGVVLVMMMHLYTEVGYVTILVMWGGFFLISVVERLTTHRRDETERNANSKWGINLTVLGLSVHSLADGLNLVIAAREEILGGALASAILIHRLPVGTLITVALLRNQTFTKSLVRLTPLIVGPVFGVLLGEQLLRGAFKDLTDYLAAFAVGTLLHVVMDGFRGHYTTESAGLSRIAKALFAIGFVLTFCAIYFLQGFEGGHVH
jgi:zinc transporter ZupT